MRRSYRPYVIAAASILAAACSDSTAPTSSSPSAVVAAQATNLGGIASAKKSVGQTVVFTLHPQGGSVYIGAFRLDYPANVVCDPVKSEYGRNSWKKACETLNGPIVMTAHYTNVDGLGSIEFESNIRFDPSKEVRLTAFVRDLKNRHLTDELRALYSIKSIGDEGDNEPTVFELKRNGTSTGKISRRIYHFSGYNVFRGEACDETAGDPDCVAI